LLYPLLDKPRFQYALNAAKAVLTELRNPAPPIPVEEYFKIKKWKIRYEELFGPDGYMIKVSKKGKNRFLVYVATDPDPEQPTDAHTVRRRQFFTLAHELGHILLHGQFLLNSKDSMNEIPEDIARIMEAEANFFASRLLMPNYVFQRLSDLVPVNLAAKCGVNVSPAILRLRKLDKGIVHSLFKVTRLDKIADTVIESEPFERELKYPSWQFYMKEGKISPILYICGDCGLMHNESMLFMECCEECHGELVRAK